jgi:phosphoserine phosphatase
VYLVSATIEEVVFGLACALGSDGALGTVAEVADGRYTGRALRTCLGEEKLETVRRLAETDGIEVAAATAYSDSSTDLVFLEAVGNPVAVNPDRRLRSLSHERGWSVLEFREHPPRPRAG